MHHTNRSKELETDDLGENLSDPTSDHRTFGISFLGASNILGRPGGYLSSYDRAEPCRSLSCSATLGKLPDHPTLSGSSTETAPHQAVQPAPEKNTITNINNYAVLLETD
jgi:hypothetical protein